MYEPICEKMPNLAKSNNVHKFLDPDTDDFWNSSNSSSSKNSIRLWWNLRDDPFISSFFTWSC